MRDLLHVEDLVDLVEGQLLAAETLGGRTVNVGGGREGSLSLRETTRICRGLTGNEVPIDAGARNAAGGRADLPLRLRGAVRPHDWRPQRGAEQTLRDIHEWIRSDEERIAGALGFDRSAR